MQSDTILNLELDAQKPAAFEDEDYQILSSAQQLTELHPGFRLFGLIPAADLDLSLTYR